MKFGQILLCCMINISSMFLAECWRLEISSRLFYDFIKMAIQQDLPVFNVWHVSFLIVLYTSFQKTLESIPSPRNCLKDYWKLSPLLISIHWPSLVTSWVVVRKIYSKMHLVLCTNTHRDVTDLVNHGMVKNTKTWISRERNITFLWNKKNINLCLKWRILGSYYFVAEVTFNEEYTIIGYQKII